MKIEYKNIPLFRALEEDVLELIDTQIHNNTFQKGVVIHFENEPCEYLEIITKGTIHIEQWNAQGDIKILRDYHPHDIFGLNTLFSSTPVYFMNVISIEDTTIYRLHKSIVESLLHNSGVFRTHFIQLLSDNTTKIGMQLKSNFKQSLRHKITQYLLEQQIIQGRTIITLHTSKTQLSQRFGVERTSLSRELQKMKRENLILFDRYSITILF